MRKIFYAMQFKGRMSAAAADAKLLRATGSATGCVVSTSIGRDGIATDLKPSDNGDLAFLESELRLTGPDSFHEGGTITFGNESENVLRFSTAGEGHLARSPEPEIMAGCVTWKIEGGEGQFAAARGFITSAFTLNDSGELSDFHCGLIFLPG